MKLPKEYEELLLKGCKWAKKQETLILRDGVPLSTDQKIDAYLVGIKDIEKVRLLKVDKIPNPEDPVLRKIMDEVGLLSLNAIGTAFRYGIYIRSDSWNNRKLVIHELTHTMQYERLGGFEPFLKEYILECMTVGYPNGPLEKEAIRFETEIGNKH